ncbi:1-aminocyclopropane-1-carboxylate deaminase/D-cysteine desulfhydrase [Undibacterium sp.]|uniref:1-aminocyclopropane-1-carboxylate deaminase/D-cysteine desulfhydrase n=1 Tax=Undibacterium sp. TaxID=1914977 RepID=UPI0025F22F1F|nr:pyridoxal-phosphate dependent enzyme [Undibacterium sp.]
MQLFQDIQHFSPLQVLKSRFFPGIQLWVKRDDLLHPMVSGNKFRKLKYPLLALQGCSPSLVTMGGAWSNHLHATAHAAKLAGYPALALVRGYAQDQGQMTATLYDCRALGMHIQFVSRDGYRDLRAIPDAWRSHVSGLREPLVWLPEGGSDPAALPGVAELVAELVSALGQWPDTVLVACGTGATLAGILAGMQGQGRVLGVAAIKNAEYLHAEIASLLQRAGYPAYQNYELLGDFHHGGYAKAPPALRQFCADLTAETGLPLEPVYTGKMFYALHQLVMAGKFRAGENVVAIHTGGLQGARGFDMDTR